MFDKLDQIEARYEDLGRQLGDPALLADQKKFQTVAKQLLRSYKGTDGFWPTAHIPTLRAAAAQELGIEL